MASLLLHETTPGVETGVKTGILKSFWAGRYYSYQPVDPVCS